MGLDIVFGSVILIYVVINLVLWKRGKKFNKSREFIKFMFLIYFFGVSVYTLNLYGGYVSNKSFNYIPFVETFRMIKDSGLSVAKHNIVGNLIMLAPLGMFVGALYKKCNSVLKIAGITFMCSAIIEINQHFTGRFADIDDIILNTTGGVLGYLIYKLLIPYVKKIRFFRELFDNAVNDKSAIKGILIVALPLFLVIGIDSTVTTYIDYKENAVDISTVPQSIEDDGRRIIGEFEDVGSKIFISKDSKGKYFEEDYYKNGDYFRKNGDAEVINRESALYLYKENDDFITYNIIGITNVTENDIEYEFINELALYVKAPNGSNITLEYGGKEVSFEVTEEVEFKRIDISEFKIEYNFEDKNPDEVIKKIKVKIK